MVAGQITLTTMLMLEEQELYDKVTKVDLMLVVIMVLGVVVAH